MTEALLWIVLSLSAGTVVLSAVLLARLSSPTRDGGREVREELRAGREEARSAGKDLRDEVATSVKTVNETLAKTLETMSRLQQAQLDGMNRQLKDLTESSHNGLMRVRDALDARVKELQEGNEKKLEQMRRTVDEKLQETLEKRLGESFKVVSERLEAVHKGLGEMQVLATGVGDLKRVLTNVKTRGTWAEFSVRAILEQILTPEQYAYNVAVKPGAAERVEYAVKLPGPTGDTDACVWLPIDSKFPQEDYLRVQEAAEKADAAAVQAAVDALARAVKKSARDISDKYICPPHTTDFGILFLATEGLYAEVLRLPALVQQLQQQYHIVLAGPTTLAALLNSLRMGFQTLAIEKRASEVWNVLAAVKTEFGKFGSMLAKVHKQLQSASNTIEQTGARTRAIERKLREVQQLPDAEIEEALLVEDSAQGDAGEYGDEGEA